MPCPETPPYIRALLSCPKRAITAVRAPSRSAAGMQLLLMACRSPGQCSCCHNRSQFNWENCRIAVCWRSIAASDCSCSARTNSTPSASTQGSKPLPPLLLLQLSAPETLSGRLDDPPSSNSSSSSSFQVWIACHFQSLPPTQQAQGQGHDEV